MAKHDSCIAPAEMAKWDQQLAKETDQRHYTCIIFLYLQRACADALDYTTREGLTPMLSQGDCITLGGHIAEFLFESLEEDSV